MANHNPTSWFRTIWLAEAGHEDRLSRLQRLGPGGAAGYHSARPHREVPRRVELPDAGTQDWVEHRRGQWERLLRGLPAGRLDRLHAGSGRRGDRPDGSGLHVAVRPQVRRAAAGFPGANLLQPGHRLQVPDEPLDGERDREREYIQATSFLPSGTFNFTLARGARTKVHQNTRQDVARNYAGDWTFIPANSTTGVDLETVVRSSGKASQQAVKGSVSIKRTSPDSILARTANGCEWKLEVTGNTAELAGVQTCHLPNNSSQTYSFWAIIARYWPPHQKLA